MRKKIVAVNISNCSFRWIIEDMNERVEILKSNHIPIQRISYKPGAWFIDTPMVTINFIFNDPKHIIGTKWDAMFGFPDEIVRERVYPQPVFGGSLVDYIKKVNEEYIDFLKEEFEKRYAQGEIEQPYKEETK